MGRFIRDWQQAFRRRGGERRLRQCRMTVEALEERALLSAAPHLGAHGHELAHHAKKAVPGYQQTNLVSDLSSKGAQVVDSNLKDPWGMAFSTTSPFWISDQATGLATLYSVNQSGTPTKLSLVVTIPGGHPTGQVVNTTGSKSDFLVPYPDGSDLPAGFIFATLQGTIAAWNAGPNPKTSLHTTAVTVVTQPGAEFTGLALGSSGGQNLLYAANGGSSPGIDVYNSSFTKVTLTGNFVDPKLSKGAFKKFVPYNIQNINGQLFVTYRGSSSFSAKGGAVAEFNPDGTFVKQIASNSGKGNLAAPWGVTVAPTDFGKFSNALLVGNFGNGRISAYNAAGKFLGQLADVHKKPIVIPFLWAIGFGNGQGAGPTSTLFFDAGINNETDGIFGSLKAVTS